MASPGPGDPVVTAYAQRLIEAWLAIKSAPGEKKRTGIALAAKAGIAKSAPSQIQAKKLGVGGALARGLAKAFDLTVPDLYIDAYAWEAEGRPNEFFPPSQSRDLGPLIHRFPRRWSPSGIQRAAQYEQEGFIPRDGWVRWLDEFAAIPAKGVAK